MNSKISNWLLNQDENFLSKIKDAGKRSSLLDQLYRARITCMFLLVIIAVLVIFFVFSGAEGNATALALFLFGSQVLNYLDTDSKIRTIKIYELLLAGNKKQ